MSRDTRRSGNYLYGNAISHSSQYSFSLGGPFWLRRGYIYTITVSICKSDAGQLSYSCENRTKLPLLAPRKPSILSWLEPGPRAILHNRRAAGRDRIETG